MFRSVRSRPQLQLLHASSAAGHDAVHRVRRDASEAADGGDSIFICLLKRHKRDGMGETRGQCKSCGVGGCAGEIAQSRQLDEIALERNLRPIDLQI